MIFFTIPYVKHIDYLKETLESLLKQSDPLWRATVFDNSTESVESQKCETLIRALHDPRIIYSKNIKHLGMAANWNQGFDHIQDDLGICILHSDDRLLPDYVKVMRTALQEFPETVAFFCKTNIIDESSKPVFSFADWYKKLLVPGGTWVTLNGLDGIKKLIPGNFVFCPTLCFNVKKIENARFDAERKMVVDFDLTLRFLLAGKTMKGYYEKPLYEYRRHALNLTTEMNKNMIRFREEFDLYQWLANELAAIGRSDLAVKARKGQIVKYNLMFQMFLHFISGKWNQVPNYFNFLRSLH